jgi:hypothetical protein
MNATFERFLYRHPRWSYRLDDDSAVAGVVAGLIMLAAIVGFLAYVQVAWVPAYVGNKESSHANDVSAAMNAYADAVDDHVQRGVVSRAFIRAVPLGVGGIPILGAGASSDDMAVEAGPTMNVTLGGAPLATAAGAVSVTTHTLQYPNQTHRYALGALEVSQPDGAFVDLRGVLTAQRVAGGLVNVTLQLVDVTGAPQSAGGSGQGQISSTLNSVSNESHAAGPFLRINVTGLSGTGGAWRAAINRTLAADSLVGEVRDSAGGGCYATTKGYCFFAENNTAARVDVLIRNVASGWTTVTGVVAAEVRG